MVSFTNMIGAYNYIARSESDAKNIFEQEDESIPHIKLIGGHAYLIRNKIDGGVKMPIDDAMNALNSIGNM